MKILCNITNKLRKFFFPYFYCEDGVSNHSFKWTLAAVNDFETRTGECGRCGLKTVTHKSSDSYSEIWMNKDGKIISKKTLYFTKEFYEL